MPPSAVQAELAKLFDRYGAPRKIRVDNGAPWGSSGDLPPALSLWFVGLGIDVLWIPARQPQKNGTIERSQGTGKRWSEPRRCGSAAELQKRIDEADEIQRDAYPSVAGRSRSAAFPELRRSDPKAWRRRSWSLTRVLEHLSEYVLARRVDKVGKVGVYGRGLYVGKRKGADRQVFVTLDPRAKEWVVTDAAGAPLRRYAADELNETNIRRLCINPRRASGKTCRPPSAAKLAGR